MAEKGRRHRFYLPEDFDRARSMTLGQDAANQMRRVLRLREGDRITLFDGRGAEVDAALVKFERGNVQVKVVDGPRPGIPATRPEVHLGVALLKSDRFDLVVQKATELGVASVTALNCVHCVVSLSADRARSRVERWQRIAIEALEQSGRADFARVNSVSDFTDYVSECQTESRLIAWEGERDSTMVELVPDDCSSICVVVGPEGGLTTEEVRHAEATGFQSVSLGPTILRSETAAIAAVAMINAASQRLRFPAQGSLE